MSLFVSVRDSGLGYKVWCSALKLGTYHVVTFSFQGSATVSEVRVLPRVISVFKIIVSPRDLFVGPGVGPCVCGFSCCYKDFWVGG